MDIVTEELPEFVVVSLAGRLDSTSTPDFEKAMRQVVESKQGRVLLDCSGLRYVSSIGIGAFVQSGKALTASGRTLWFASLSPHVRSVFDIVGLGKLFEIYPTREAAQERSRAVGTGD